MTDLRQGVTPTQHDVLDLVDSLKATEARYTRKPGPVAGADLQIAYAAESLRASERATTLIGKRIYALAAAARAIIAVEDFDRMIAKEGNLP